MATTPYPPLVTPPTTICSTCDEEGNIIEWESSSSCPAGTFTSPGACAGTGCPMSSVLLSSGQFSFQRQLLAIDAVGGIGWSFALRYLAGSGVDSVLGKGFNFPQEMRLFERSDGRIDLLTPGTGVETFVPNGSGGYAPETGNNTRAQLLRSGSGADDEFTLIAHKGTQTRFYGFAAEVSTPGRLKSITDRFGSQQTYVWERPSGSELDHLQSVTDAYGRTVQYRYYGAEFGYRLREIEDFLGRKLNFQFDALGHLVAVVTPSILRAAEGNTFPGGTAYVFQYDVTNRRAERRDDLIRIWYPNQAAPHVNAETRTVDVAAVYAEATPRYVVEYGQDPTDPDLWGRVAWETIGDPDAQVGGFFQYLYSTANLPANLIDPSDPIVFRSVVTDRNGNQTIYDFNNRDMPVRVEVMRTRSKINIPSFASFPSFVTWTKYNANNQPVLKVFPGGNSEEYEYEDGQVPGWGWTNRRQGLLRRRTRRPGNPLGLPFRPGSNGQTELSERYFYDPLFNQPCAVIETRGNPVAAEGGYFAPQNGGTSPTDADRSRYATRTYLDYQKNSRATVQNDADLQERLGLTAQQIGLLIDYVDGQLQAVDGSGGLPAGFELGLGDINGDGTGDGASSGLPAAKSLGNTVKVRHPDVRVIGVADITTQVREELFTTNDRGQVTTHTDPEGNLTVYVRYPFNDPEGDGQFVAPDLSTQQYGRLRAVYVDADPNDVMSLVGASGDLQAFVGGRIARTNTPGVHQNLVTRFAGSSGGSCTSCAYDPLGNLLAQTDPRGFTTRWDRNELGEAYRSTAPQPYGFRVETQYDANRNVVRVDTEDRVVAFVSDDPTSADYAKFVPTGSGSTAQIPMRAGPGGQVRPGWFTNLSSFDLLDNKIEEDLDATGSTPASLVTRYAHDANQNLVRVTKPEGNVVEYDYDERNLRIAERVGRDPDAGQSGALTLLAYDANGNLLQRIGPAQRGAAGNWQTALIEDAFHSGVTLTHTGDFQAEYVYDGFDRLIQTTDAVGNVTVFRHDPEGRVIEAIERGVIGGATPTDRNGANNVDLTKATQRYDEAGRSYEMEQAVFVADGVTLPSGNRAVAHTGGGLAANSVANDHTATVTLVDGTGQATGNASYVLTRSVYDRAGRTVTAIQDNAAATIRDYDGANRSIRETDALGNEVAYQYDGNANVTAVTRTEKCTITQPAVADEVFRSALRYDAVNRLVVRAEQGANGTLSSNLADPDTLFVLSGYDSRGNKTLAIDPKGNTALTVYDGAGRAAQVQQHLRVAGRGENPPAPGTTFLPLGGACVTTTTVYDGNGRVRRLIDDRGNTTQWEYDTLDRETAMRFADGETRRRTYNEAGDVIQLTDENGSVFDNTFDPLGRKVQCLVTKAAGVAGTDRQAFEYDGRSRRTRSVDAVDTAETVVEQRYDSLGRVLEDGQTTGGTALRVTHSGFNSNALSEFTFPNGRRIANSYDALYRRTHVGDVGGGTIATWQFFGPSRVAEVALGNGLICTHLNNTRTHAAVSQAVSLPSWGDPSSDRLGYDGAGRPITKRYLAGGIDPDSHAYADPTCVVGFTTTYDRSSNKLYERHLHAESRSHLYEWLSDPSAPDADSFAYDSLDRLRGYERGILAEGGGSVVTPISLPGTDQRRTYDLDTLGNWRRTAYIPVGGTSTTEVRQHNNLNQITQRDSTLFAYDANGNLLDDGIRLYTWDAFNRLIEVRRASDSAVIGQYVYDAGGRRVSKTVSNGGLSGTIPNGMTRAAYNSGWQCVEERDAYNSPLKQYVWGTYIDELLQQRTPATINQHGAGDYYLLSDLLWRSVALTDTTGQIIETYDCDAYGNTLIFGSPGSGGNWWGGDSVRSDLAMCSTIYTGRSYDGESRLHSYRTRVLLSPLGRFLSPDSVGVEEGDGVYQYARSSPTNRLDADGTLSFLGCTPWTKTTVACTATEHKACDFQCRRQGDPGGRAGSCFQATRTCTICGIYTLGQMVRVVQCSCKKKKLCDCYCIAVDGRGAEHGPYQQGKMAERDCLRIPETDKGKALNYVRCFCK